MLGCGASIYKWTKKGDTVDDSIMSAEGKTRAFRPENNNIDDTQSVLKFIDVYKEYEG